MKDMLQMSLASAACGLLFTTACGLAQGSLTPPGPPGPTMITLSQIEPRTIVNATNTPGNASYAFIISQPGSYYLATNLTVPLNLGGICILTNNVTLDLKGFTLQPSASSAIGNGIIILFPQTNITVLNGSLTGWPISGVISYGGNSANLVFERLNLSGGNYGIEIEGAAVVRDCNIQGNTSEGISTSGNGSIISGCAVRNNGQDGIYCLDGTITGCVAEYNTYDGIYCAAGTINGCVANYNTGQGFYCGNGTVTKCVAYSNSNLGIYCTMGNITGCTCVANGIWGIQTGNNSIVRECIVTENPTGISTGNYSLISGCTVTGSTNTGVTTGTVCKVTDCIVAGNGNYGIMTGDNAQITGCHVNGNAPAGIKLTSYSLARDNMVDYSMQTTTNAGITMSGNRNRVEGNNITRCGIGLQATSSANLIVRNSVSGSSGVAYSIVSGNSVGVIVVPTSSGTISGSSGGGIGSTDPNANFVY